MVTGGLVAQLLLVQLLISLHTVVVAVEVELFLVLSAVEEEEAVQEVQGLLVQLLRVQAALRVQELSRLSVVQVRLRESTVRQVDVQSSGEQAVVDIPTCRQMAPAEQRSLEVEQVELAVEQPRPQQPLQPQQVEIQILIR